MESLIGPTGVLLVVVVDAARHRDGVRARDVRLQAPAEPGAGQRRAGAPSAGLLGHRLHELRPQRRRDLAQDHAARRQGRGAPSSTRRLPHDIILSYVMMADGGNASIYFVYLNRVP
jgi:hypothetical protein